MADTDICGKFRLTSSENFDEFLKALGVNIVMRKLAATSKPLVEVSKADDEWTIKTTTTFKTSEIKFKLGDEFEETRLDGVTVKTVMTREGNTLIQKQFGDKELTITREFSGDELKTVCTVDDVVSTRIYKKE